MDLAIKTYDDTLFARTSTLNMISKLHKISGTQNIMIAGKTIVEDGVSIRGDLCTAKIGRYCVIQKRTIIHPCFKVFTQKASMCNIIIGEYVFIEEDVVVNATQIFSYVHIGARSVLGSGCIIRECSRVLPDSVVPADVVFPPYSTIGGNPAKVIGQEPPCTESLMIEATTSYYDNFVPQNSQKTSFA